jgi:hypothetical protein
MSSRAETFTVMFPDWYDARAEFETPSKGYLPEVEVRLENGVRYKLYFIDLVRLQQTLEDDVQAGREYFAEPGMVVLPQVTTEAIQKAVVGLVEDGYFQRLKTSGDDGTQP